MGIQNCKTSLKAQILMLGLDGCGKSTLLYKLKHNKAVVTVPTVGFNVEMLETLDKGWVLTVWDIGGQHRMRVHWKHYYQDTAGLVFVVDSQNRGRLAEASRELGQVLENECLKNLPLIVLANKQDLEGALSGEDIAEALNLRELCSNRNWVVQPCSAKTGAGLECGFLSMVHLLKTAVVEGEDSWSNSGIHLK